MCIRDSLLVAAQTGGAGDGDLAGITQAFEEGNAGGENIGFLGGNGEVCLFGGGDVHLGPAGADGFHGLHEHLHRFLLLGEGQAGLGLGPGLEHEKLHLVVRRMGQGLPDFLGEEGHEGMQELERLREHIAPVSYTHLSKVGQADRIVDDGIWEAL